MKQRNLVLLTAAVMLIGFLVATALYQRQQAATAARLAAEHAAGLTRPYSPTLGAAEAPVVIVEFFDPACGTCQAFHAPLKQLLDDHPGQLRLVLRYAPFQVGAEHIVALLEAARRQDRFWPVLDRLMETQDHWKPGHEAELGLAWPQLAGLGLDLDRLRLDMGDAEISRRINQDQDDASRLKVDTTPTFYVNGHPLPGFGFSVLRQTVDAALKMAGH